MSANPSVTSVEHRFSAAEWQQRTDLAACYRLVAQHGWSDLVFTHITAKVPGPEHHFLINPYGLLFHEITASNLIKIDPDGNKVDESPYPVNKAGFIIHSAIHSARANAMCVLHTHTRSGVAVSAQRCGLLPISQQSTFVLPSLAYHGYEGVAVREDERPRLQANLGDNNFMCLRNHGLLTVGSSVAEAFLGMYVFESACQIQLAAQAGGELLTVAPEILEGTAAALRIQTGGMGAQFVWPSLLRDLDRKSPDYRT